MNKIKVGFNASLISHKCTSQSLVEMYVESILTVSGRIVNMGHMVDGNDSSCAELHRATQTPEDYDSVKCSRNAPHYSGKC